MKSLDIVCGAILEDGKLLIAKRGKGTGEGFYEFPGGKVEIGETREEALIREMKEELNIDITFPEYLISIQDKQDETPLQVHAYLCHIKKGTPALSVHTEMYWVAPKELYEYKFQDADKGILDKINDVLQIKGSNL